MSFFSGSRLIIKRKLLSRSKPCIFCHKLFKCFMWNKLIVFQCFNNCSFLFFLSLEHSRLSSTFNRIYRLICLFGKYTIYISFRASRLHCIFEHACFIPLLSVNSSFSSTVVISHACIPSSLSSKGNTWLTRALCCRCHYTFKITHCWLRSCINIIIHKCSRHFLQIMISQLTSSRLSFSSSFHYTFI